MTIQRNSSYSPRVASDTFGTSVMKTDEFYLFVQAAVENGSSLEEAYEDAKMIDDILHIKHLHLIVHGEIKKTKTGGFRKGSDLYSAIESAIEARALNS